MGVLDDFINGEDTEAVDFPIADASDPVNWVGLANTIIGSFVAGTASALIAIPAAIAEAYTNVIDGVREFVVSGSDAVYGPLIETVTGVWSFGLVDDLGLLGMPFTFAIVLASVYLFTQGARRAIDVFFGGDVL